MGGAPALRKLKNTPDMAWKLIPGPFSEEFGKVCMKNLTCFDRFAITYSNIVNLFQIFYFPIEIMVDSL